MSYEVENIALQRSVPKTKYKLPRKGFRKIFVLEIPNRIIYLKMKYKYSRINGGCIYAAIASAFAVGEIDFNEKNNGTWGSYFEVFMAVLDVISDIKKQKKSKNEDDQGGESVAASTSIVSSTTGATVSNKLNKMGKTLQFYNSTGRRVAIPPEEKHTNLPDTLDNICPERLFAWKLRKMLVGGTKRRVGGNPPNDRRIRHFPVIEKTILSQSFMYDPLQLAQIQWKNWKWQKPPLPRPLNNSLIYSCAIGLCGDVDTIEDYSEYITRVTNPHNICIATSLTLSMFIHKCVNAFKQGTTITQLITESIECGIKFMPENEHRNYRQIHTININKIGLHSDCNNSLKSLSLCFWVAKETVDHIMRTGNLNITDGTEFSWSVWMKFREMISKVKTMTADPISKEINCILVGMVFGCITGIEYVNNPKECLSDYISIRSKIADFLSQ